MNPAWLKITWPQVPGKTYTIYWSADRSSWDAVGGPALDDIVDNGDGTWTWTDKGTDPEMGGKAPGDVHKRFYKVGVAEELPLSGGGTALGHASLGDSSEGGLEGTSSSTPPSGVSGARSSATGGATEDAGEARRGNVRKGSGNVHAR